MYYVYLLRSESNPTQTYRLNRQSAKTIRRAQFRQICAHEKIRALVVDGLLRLSGEDDRGALRGKSQKRLGARIRKAALVEYIGK